MGTMKWLTHSKEFNMKEGLIQTKIVTYLKSIGCSIIKIQGSTHTIGEPDLVGCTPQGQFIAIEVKTEKGRPSPIQKAKIQTYLNKGAISMIAFGYEDFAIKWGEQYDTK